jgi:hypothetical protein
MCYPCLRTPVTYVSGPYTAAKKVGKESRFEPPAHKRVPRTATIVVHLESVFSHIRPS